MKKENATFRISEKAATKVVAEGLTYDFTAILAWLENQAYDSTWNLLQYVVKEGLKQAVRRRAAKAADGDVEAYAHEIILILNDLQDKGLITFDSVGKQAHVGSSDPKRLMAAAADPEKAALLRKLLES